MLGSGTKFKLQIEIIADAAKLCGKEISSHLMKLQETCSAWWQGIEHCIAV